MERVCTTSQEESNVEKQIDELAITMAKLDECRVELFMGKSRTIVQIQPIPLES